MRMQVTDAMQPRTPTAEVRLDNNRLEGEYWMLYAQVYMVVHSLRTWQRLGGEPGPLGTWALDRTG